jgi:hypothetical protein
MPTEIELTSIEMIESQFSSTRKMNLTFIPVGSAGSRGSVIELPSCAVEWHAELTGSMKAP